MKILVAPEVDELSRPFWEACNEGRLVLQRCVRCRRFIHHPEQRCPFCGSRAIATAEVSGLGTIETFTVVYRSFVPEYRQATPYVIGWVALDEQPGLRMFSQIEGAIPDMEGASGPGLAWDGSGGLEESAAGPGGVIKIGARVRAAFAEVHEFGKAPYFVCE